MDLFCDDLIKILISYTGGNTFLATNKKYYLLSKQLDVHVNKILLNDVNLFLKTFEDYSNIVIDNFNDPHMFKSSDEFKMVFNGNIIKKIAIKGNGRFRWKAHNTSVDELAIYSRQESAILQVLDCFNNLKKATVVMIDDDYTKYKYRDNTTFNTYHTYSFLYMKHVVIKWTCVEITKLSATTKTLEMCAKMVFLYFRDITTHHKNLKIETDRLDVAGYYIHFTNVYVKFALLLSQNFIQSDHIKKMTVDYTNFIKFTWSGRYFKLEEIFISGVVRLDINAPKLKKITIFGEDMFDGTLNRFYNVDVHVCTRNINIDALNALVGKCNAVYIGNDIQWK